MNWRFLSMIFLLLPALAAADPDASRQEFRVALDKIEAGGALGNNERYALRDHPLIGYLEYAQLGRRLDTAKTADVERFLTRYKDWPIAAELRRRWLTELARREDWTTFERDWSEQTDPELRCHAASAALALRPDDGAALDAAQALWLNGQSVPAACDRAFTRLAMANRITDALRLQRIGLAREAGNSRLMRFLARGLAAGARAEVEAQSGYIDQPGPGHANWMDTAEGAAAVAIGIERLARSDAQRDRAEQLLDKLAAAGLPEDALQRGRYALALWSAASYESSARRRLAAVAAHRYDPRLHEWRVREAIARNDWSDADRALAAMGAEQAAEPRWRYLRGRVDQQLGRSQAATSTFAALAREAHYHGFLAADQLGDPYAMCALEPGNDRKRRAEVEANPQFQRALDLHAIGRERWALAEWNALAAALNDEYRRIAVDLAVDAGWTDRAVFALNSGEDLRLYRLRFPVAHKSHLTREASRHGVDAAWVAALIRAESAWQPSARSHANARGLMQLLPGTGAALARREGIGWKGASTLYEPRTNISLGTAYLAELLDQQSAQPYLVTAAYNAGPSPVARWLKARPPTDADLWIETIPYKETRDYVTRVMAFSVIYDWRLGRDAYPLSQRLLAQPQSSVQRRGFQCPGQTRTAGQP